MKNTNSLVLSAPALDVSTHAGTVHMFLKAHSVSNKNHGVYIYVTCFKSQCVEFLHGYIFMWIINSFHFICHFIPPNIIKHHNLGAAEEKENIELAPEIQDIISNAGSIQADDIAIVEDQDEGKLIIRSRAPSAASVRSALSIRVPDLSKSRAASVESPSDERAISVVASENIPSVVVQSEDDDDTKDDDNEDVQPISRVPSVAELHQILDEKAASENEDGEMREFEQACTAQNL